MSLYSFQASSTSSGASAASSTRLVKPSFVAPSQPLEKSLKEHIQRTAGKTYPMSKDTKGHVKYFSYLSISIFNTHGVIFLHIAAIVYYINTLDGLSSQMWD